MKKGLNIILNLVLVLILIFLVFSVFKRPLLGYQVFTVRSNSMEPVLKKHDLIIIRKEKDYKLKDIITYKKKGSYITHRLIDKLNDTYVTKGDANNEIDKKINKKDVVGKYIFKISLIRYIVMVLTNPLLLILLFIPLMVLGVYLNKRRKDNYGSQKN